MHAVRQQRVGTRRRPWACLVLGLAVLLGACASGPKYSPQALEIAESEGRLEAIYAELTAPKSGLDRLKPDAEADLRAVIDRLVRRDLAALSADIDRRRLPAPVQGYVPLTAFPEFEPAIDAVGRWSAVGRERARTVVTTEMARTNDAIALRRLEALSLPREQVARRLDKFDQMGLLGGPGSTEAQEAVQQREQAVNALLGETRTAIRADRADSVAARLAILATVAPDHPELARLNAILDLMRINQAMREATGDAARDAVWLRLEALTEKTDLSALRPEAEASLIELRSAQLVDAGAALAADRMANCRQALLRARQLARVLGEHRRPPEETAYVDRLQRAADAAAARSAFGLEFGYRLAVREIQADYPMLQVTLAESAQRVWEDSVPGVAVEAVALNDADRDLAVSLAAKLSAAIGGQLANDLRLVRLPTKEGDAAGSASASPPALTLTAAVVRARVDTTENERMERMRVRTGTRLITNPEHARWMRLPEAERGDPAPPPEIAQPVMEDVSVGVVTRHKTARLEAACRVLRTADGRTPVDENLSLTASAEGMRSGAVEIGEFVQAERRDPLPDDRAMLEGLVGEVVTHCSDQMAKEFGALEQRLAALADAAQAAADVGAAIRLRSAAIVVGERKSVDLGAQRERLRDAVLALPTIN